MTTLAKDTVVCARPTPKPPFAHLQGYSEPLRLDDVDTRPFARTNDEFTVYDSASGLRLEGMPDDDLLSQWAESRGPILAALCRSGFWRPVNTVAADYLAETGMFVASVYVR